MQPEKKALGPSSRRPATNDPWYVRAALVAAAAIVVLLLIGVPVGNVFWQALGSGIRSYLNNFLSDADTIDAIRLTLIVAPVAVLANVVFGVTAAWAIARFEFPGRTALITLIDLPFSVSPVVAGLVFVLLCGQQG